MIDPLFVLTRRSTLPIQIMELLLQIFWTATLMSSSSIEICCVSIFVVQSHQIDTRASGTINNWLFFIDFETSSKLLFPIEYTMVWPDILSWSLIQILKFVQVGNWLSSIEVMLFTFWVIAISGPGSRGSRNWLGVLFSLGKFIIDVERPSKTWSTIIV